MTYYGWRVIFHLTFRCGCSHDQGPIHEKFAYQYAGLGRKQKCKEHRAWEIKRVVEKVDGPHGDYELGWWTRDNGTKIFLTWSPASGWVTLCDRTEGRYPVDWRRRRLVNIPHERTIWRLVGGNHLGGDRPEPADEILFRFRGADRSVSSETAGSVEIS